MYLASLSEKSTQVVASTTQKLWWYKITMSWTRWWSTEDLAHMPFRSRFTLMETTWPPWLEMELLFQHLLVQPLIIWQQVGQWYRLIANVFVWLRWHLTLWASGLWSCQFQPLWNSRNLPTTEELLGCLLTDPPDLSFTRERNWQWLARSALWVWLWILQTTWWTCGDGDL